MDARELESKMNYLGMERSARKLLVNEGLVKAEDMAEMTCVEMCDALLHYYEVVSCEDECITVVRHKDVAKYHSIVSYLSR